MWTCKRTPRPFSEEVKQLSRVVTVVAIFLAHTPNEQVKVYGTFHRFSSATEFGNVITNGRDLRFSGFNLSIGELGRVLASSLRFDV